MRRRVHTQGDLDGTCFLYSLANAFTALRGQAPDLKRWDEAVSTLKWPMDLLRPCVGTAEHYEKDFAELERAAASVIESLADGRIVLSVDPQPKTCDLAGLAQLVGPDSVAVFRYKGSTRLVANGDHWVCAVAADAAPLRVHIACSIRRSDDGRFNDRIYQETHHKGSNRYSNDWVDASMECRIMKGFTLQVVRSRPSGGSDPATPGEGEGRETE